MDSWFCNRWIICCATFSNAFCLTKLLNFDIMQVQVDIGFDQLVQLAKGLPTTQWIKLKQEVEAQAPVDKEREDFRNLLMNGQTFSKKQLDTVAEIRKRIDEWRTA